MIEVKEYEDFCASIDHSNLNAIVYGLGEEAGEVLGKFKRLERDLLGEPTPEWLHAMMLELGDTLYYLTRIAARHGYTLQDVMQANAVKLTARRAASTLQGEGDKR